jgi:hypothetical protein
MQPTPNTDQTRRSQCFVSQNATQNLARVTGENLSLRRSPTPNDRRNSPGCASGESQATAFTPRTRHPHAGNFARLLCEKLVFPASGPAAPHCGAGRPARAGGRTAETGCSNGFFPA